MCSWFPSTRHNTSTRHFINFAHLGIQPVKNLRHINLTRHCTICIYYSHQTFFKLFSFVQVLHQEFKSIFTGLLFHHSFFSRKNQTTLFFGTIISGIFRGASIGFEPFCEETVNICFKTMSPVEWRVLLSSHKSAKVLHSLHSIQPRYEQSF